MESPAKFCSELNRATNDVLGLIVEYCGLEGLVQLSACGDSRLRMKLSKSVQYISEWFCGSNGPFRSLPSSTLEYLTSLKTIRFRFHWPRSIDPKFGVRGAIAPLSQLTQLPRGLRDLSLLTIRSFNKPSNVTLDLAELFPHLEILRLGSKQGGEISVLPITSFPSTLTKLSILLGIGSDRTAFYLFLPESLHYLEVTCARMMGDTGLKWNWLSRLVRLHTLKLPKLSLYDDEFLEHLPSSLSRLEIESATYLHEHKKVPYHPSSKLPRSLTSLKVRSGFPVDVEHMPPLLQLNLIGCPAINSNFNWQNSTLTELSGIMADNVGADLFQEVLKSLPSSLTKLVIERCKVISEDVVPLLPRGLIEFSVKTETASRFTILPPETLLQLPPHLIHIEWASYIPMGGLFDDDDYESEDHDDWLKANSKYLPKTLLSLWLDLDSPKVRFYRILYPWTPEALGAKNLPSRSIQMAKSVLSELANVSPDSRHLYPEWHTLYGALMQDSVIPFKFIWLSLPARLLPSPAKITRTIAYHNAIKCAIMLNGLGIDFEATKRQRNTDTQCALSSYYKTSREPLFLAATRGSIDILKWLTTTYKSKKNGKPIPADKVDIYGFNIAHYACTGFSNTSVKWVYSNFPHFFQVKSTGNLSLNVQPLMNSGLTPQDVCVANGYYWSIQSIINEIPDFFGDSMRPIPNGYPEPQRILLDTDRDWTDNDIMFCIKHRLTLGWFYRLYMRKDATSISVALPRIFELLVSDPSVEFNQHIVDLVHSSFQPLIQQHPKIRSLAEESGRLHWIIPEEKKE